ncbi:MAG: hypothetical protein HRJ53_03020 [Acidobacteria bacterium Pan2503]|uniref:Uncharacterized protein n=1 Tax=Candidatus Acidiferrum panamense TaxID=2741543 RepID=A0A7V8NMB1_9BACT|nr:hypothetical protein [Candidatus Acidoferrum panamensis]
MSNVLTEGFAFDAEKHEYRLGSQIVPACTQVLSSGGLVDWSYVSRDTLERRSELGKAVHKACHLHNIDRLGKYDLAVKPHLHAWIYFKERCHNFKLISSEQVTIGYVNGLPFGMTVDCNAIVDGWDTIIELKIGEMLPHHAIQTAGYAAGLPLDDKAIKTPFGRFLARRRIGVQLRENGQPKVHKFEERSDFEVFASVLYTAGWKRRHESYYREENI